MVHSQRALALRKRRAPPAAPDVLPASACWLAGHPHATRCIFQNAVSLLRRMGCVATNRVAPSKRASNHCAQASSWLRGCHAHPPGALFYVARRRLHLPTPGRPPIGSKVSWPATRCRWRLRFLTLSRGARSRAANSLTASSRRAKLSALGCCAEARLAKRPHGAHPLRAGLLSARPHRKPSSRQPN